MGRLVVVSNRVPLPSERGAKAGGLAVALADALRPGSLWFGWSGKRSSAGLTQLQRGVSITYATVDLTDSEYHKFYVNFANGVLWPLLHFRLGLLDFHAEDYQGYRAVNRRFAAALKPLLQPDDLIWIHDYHMIPMAQELRALGVTNRIGFFLHTPFVPYAVFQALPRSSELLAALCAYDVVGFHTASYRAAFLDCVETGLSIKTHQDGGFTFRGRTVQAIVDPIGIDAAGFARQAAAAVNTPDARALRSSLNNKALAIGVDRLDYSKGLSNRFIAIGRLLAMYPEHQREVSFLQVAARSREDQHAYQRLRRELDRIVGETNGKYADFDWTPLRYLTRPVKRETLAGFFRIARLAMITPLRDGMNLVAKEYVAAQDPENPGVLVLSCLAGAADEMGAAVLVNPFDPDDIADGMHRALTMDLQERRDRWQALNAVIHQNNAERFCSVFLSHLSGTRNYSDRPPLRAVS